MFSGAEILIIEDNLYVSLDIASAIEELDGQVFGPVDTVADALEMIECGSVAAAVVDCELRDTTRARWCASRSPSAFLS